jgi:acyl-coenzyme A thioesterase PaaI-like protein
VRTERLDRDGNARFDLVCPPENDEGSGIAHGGWVTSALAEMVGHTLVLSGGFGFLGTLNVRFASPVPVGEPLTGAARVDGQERRKVFVSGEVSSASALLASASAILIAAPESLAP